MFRGYFNARTGSPTVRGTLRLHGFGLAGIESNIRFEIDTGSDVTVLGPADVLRLGIDHRFLQPGPAKLGITGSTPTYTVPASLVLGLGSDGLSYGYNLFDLTVLTYDLTSGYVASLLGRDVLDRLRMVYDPAVEGLHFEVRLPVRRSGQGRALRNACCLHPPTC